MFTVVTRSPSQRGRHHWRGGGGYGGCAVYQKRVELKNRLRYNIETNGNILKKSSPKKDITTPGNVVVIYLKCGHGKYKQSAKHQVDGEDARYCRGTAGSVEQTRVNRPEAGPRAVGLKPGEVATVRARHAATAGWYQRHQHLTIRLHLSHEQKQNLIKYSKPIPLFTIGSDIKSK